jgi:aminocarboxymuconate-semialdehyde decarboxylase
MRIDVHNHFLPPAYFEFIRTCGRRIEVSTDAIGRTIFKSKGARIMGVTPEMARPEDRLRDMDRMGVDLQIISLTTPSVYFADPPDEVALARRVNDLFAALCQPHRDRFKWLATLPMKTPPAALTELDRAVQELGAVGVIVGANIDGRPLNHPDFEPIWARLDALRLPVLLHPMVPPGTEAMGEFGLVPMVGFMFDTTLAGARMTYAGIFERYPNLQMILPHLGGAIPYLLERLDNGHRAYAECRQRCPRLPSEYLRRCYYDTVSFHPPALRCALEAIGPDRILFGTDYPHVIGDIAKGISTLEDLRLSAADQARIFSETARGLFRI